MPRAIVTVRLETDHGVEISTTSNANAGLTREKALAVRGVLIASVVKTLTEYGESAAGHGAEG